VKPNGAELNAVYEAVEASIPGVGRHQIRSALNRLRVFERVGRARYRLRIKPNP
jgi:hypothetical protein